MLLVFRLTHIIKILGYFKHVLSNLGTAVGVVLQIGRSLVRFQMVSFEYFFDIKSFRSHYGPGVDSASNRNEHQEYFLGVKAAGA